MSDYTNFKTHSGMKLFFNFCTSLMVKMETMLSCVIVIKEALIREAAPFELGGQNL